MKLQRFIFKYKTEISFINLSLIIIAFSFKFIFSNILVFNILLIIASILGLFPIFLMAFQSLKIKVVSIEVLVTIAVLGAFIIKNYEESAIVTFLFLFGSFLEQKTLNKTRQAIKELLELAPENALKLIDDEFVEVDIDDVDVGDILLVKTGAKIPVDGYVIEGSGYINEASITGESMPVSKNYEANVFAGTILENGTLQIKAEKIGEDTTFGKIIELVEEAQDSKSAVIKFIDKFSRYYTPVVLLIGLLVGFFTKDIELAVTILVLGCPGALVIGVPVSNVAGIGNGARNGVLLKGSETIIDFSRVTTFVFDKTGTLTLGTPLVDKVIFYGNNENTLSYLYNIENESDHPLAKAIVKYINEYKSFKVENTEVIKGLGIVSYIDNNRILVGNINLMLKEEVIIANKVLEDIKALENSGSSIVLMAVNKNLEVLLGIKDIIRPNVKKDLLSLRELGVKNLIMLSGDNQKTVDLVASELELDLAIGNMLPEDKANYIKELQKNNAIVAFVGDGINDSPSLAVANIGIAIGSGTDVAIETSDVVLMDSSFKKLVHALGLTKRTALNMKENIVIAVGVVIILLLSVLFSDKMNMSIGMLVHEGSILAVILNGMRLLRYKLKKEN